MAKKTTVKSKSSRNTTTEHILDLTNSDYYFNRELSSLEFNAQVLAEAEDDSHPLLERLKFLCIFGTNLDEFFMIRVAALKEQAEANIIEDTADEMSPREQLRYIRRRVLKLLAKKSDLLKKVVFPSLEHNGIVFHTYHTLPSHEKEQLRSYFMSNVMPLLTPLGLDPGHPFPRLLNRSLGIAFTISDTRDGEEQIRTGVLQVPNSLPRFVDLERDQPHQLVLLEEIIQANADILFSGLNVLESYCFRVTRDADIDVDEDDTNDLMKEIAEQTRLRRWGTDAVRLEVDENMPVTMKTLLMNSLELEPTDIYEKDYPMNLHDFLALLRVDKKRLKDQPFTSRIPSEFSGDDVNIFRSLRNQDVMVHHPFDSFSNTVVKFLKQAADDPQVLAIKITLYRAGGSSPVIDALKRAAQNGKSVTAFVELKARFDEENNIVWARELEHNGVHVVYGILGLKTHAKVALVVRKERSAIRTYCHFSTGNYNQSSARVYTDIGYFTAREEFSRDAIHLFNFLTAFSQHTLYEKLIVAPLYLRQTVISLIERETDLHSPERPGRIYAKMNALVDPDTIRALYRASQKGVSIRLMVRGICCLKPGIEGVSDNIEVRCVLGRFLEHTRIFWFGNGGEDEVYISSADWMPRNFVRRVELMFRIPDKHHEHSLTQLLELYWQDNIKARRLMPDNSRVLLKPKRGEKGFSVQEYLLERTKGKK
ncbi:MAG: polyphosphate kinase 1 [Candidatus Kapabacteria bacterium]|nr:polyphosphate kinase 1 [Candidatus Kapabacteria bacterium]